VKCDDLVSDHVVSWCDVGGDPDVRRSAVHDLLLEPVAVASSTDLIDLEPPGRCGVKPITCLTATRGHVGEHGTRVVRPVLASTCFPIERYCVPGVDSGGEGSGPGVGTTIEGRVARTLDWRVCADLADGTWVGRAAWRVSGIDLASDSELIDKTVRGDLLG